MTKEKLWQKDFILISFINFLMTFIYFLLIVTIGLYAVSRFDASTGEVGIVTGIFIVGEMVGRLYIGRHVEAIGRKRSFFIGLTLLLLTTLLYFVSFTLFFLIIIRFVNGLAMGIASTLAGTIVTETIPVSRRGEGIGYFSMSFTLATATGPLIGLMMSERVPYEGIFLLSSLLAITVFILAFFLYVKEVPIPDAESESSRFTLSNYVELRALPISIIILIAAVVFSSILSFINLYAIEIELVEAASLFFLVYGIAVLGSRPFTGRLIDRKGANIVMYPCILSFSLGMFLLSMASNSMMLFISGILIGFGFGNMQSISQAIAVKLTPPHRIGLATSTYFLFLDGGLGIGPFFLGFLIPLLGYQKMYFMFTFYLLFAGVLYYFLHGRKDYLLR